MASALLGGVFLFVSAVLIGFEVVSRKLFNYSMAGADEISGYAYALSMAWGYGLVALRGEHVRVDALRVHLPSRARCLLDVIAHGAFSALMIVLVWRSVLMVEESWRLAAKSNTPLSTPLWIPQSIWLAGLIFCVLTLLLLFVRSLIAMARGDLGLVERLSEPSSGKDISMADASGG